MILCLAVTGAPSRHHPFLHFEVCYYQAIDFAIQRGLKTVEAGAQGEHKIARGYLPQTTYSAHYIADPGLRRAISDYLRRGHEPTWPRPDANSPRPDHLKNCRAFLKGPHSGEVMSAYDPNNAFAKILRGEFPSYKVYENEHVLAFSTSCRMSRAHACDPRAPARNILDIKPEDFAHVALGAHKIASAAMRAFNADGITLQQFNEPAGGQVVFHLHMHVMPRHNGVALLPPASRKEDGKTLEENAGKLIAALK